MCEGWSGLFLWRFWPLERYLYVSGMHKSFVISEPYYVECMTLPSSALKIDSICDSDDVCWVSRRDPEHFAR